MLRINRILLTISLILLLGENIHGLTNKQILDSLNSIIFAERLNHSKELLDLLYQLGNWNNDKIAKAVFQFADNHPFYAPRIITDAIKKKIPQLGRWVSLRKETFTPMHWDTIYEMYYREENPWRDSLLMKTILDVALTTDDYEIQDILTNLFSETGSFDEVVKIQQMYDKGVSQSCKTNILNSQTRFKSPKTDVFLKNRLRSISDFYILRYITKYGFKPYSRYDFLPEIYDFKSQIAKINEPEAKRALKVIEEIIPYLEQKKAERAPIGLPFDWGKPKGK